VKKNLAVVLVSGGMDSCVTAALAAQKYNLALLHLNYGQRTEQRELRSFHDIAAFYQVQKQLVVDVSHFALIGGSSLTDRQIPVQPADLHNTEIPGSYVPFRNANLLAVAVSWAEVIGATRIFIGAVEEDSSGYPDCREQFFKAFNRVISLGTKTRSGIRIITPLLHNSKKQIVETAAKLKAPLQFTWSCYQNEDQACGVCDSCALRLRGFQQAGVEDPIPYKQRPVYI
jgi:7-cyano-7-deazaguanine synthase